VDIHNKNDGRRLWKTINEFKPDSELQELYLVCGAEIREHGWAIAKRHERTRLS
jgi:hypothetical protein